MPGSNGDNFRDDFSFSLVSNDSDTDDALEIFDRVMESLRSRFPQITEDESATEDLLRFIVSKLLEEQPLQNNPKKDLSQLKLIQAKAHKILKTLLSDQTAISEAFKILETTFGKKPTSNLHAVQSAYDSISESTCLRSVPAHCAESHSGEVSLSSDESGEESEEEMYLRTHTSTQGPSRLLAECSAAQSAAEAARAAASPLASNSSRPEGAVPARTRTGHNFRETLAKLSLSEVARLYGYSAMAASATGTRGIW